MSNERFARQYRFELPSGFLLTSPCTSIVHHLSGPSMHALARRWPEGTTLCLPCARFTRLGQISVSLRIGVCHPNTRAHVRLLGPCFKTGRISPVARHDPGRAASGDAGRGVQKMSSTPGQPGSCRGRSRWHASWPARNRSCPRAVRRAHRRDGRLIRLLPTISRTISLSFQSSFHLSLTVLVRYRSRANI